MFTVTGAKMVNDATPPEGKTDRIKHMLTNIPPNVAINKLNCTYCTNICPETGCYTSWNLFDPITLIVFFSERNKTGMLHILISHQ